MYSNFTFDDVNEALPRLLQHLDGAQEVGSRAGRTREMTHVGITLTKPWQREILLPARKPNLAAQIAETVWVLAGNDDIGWLGNYLPRAKDFSDDGMTWRAGYGRRLRSWPRRDGSDDTIDQIRWVFDHLRSSPSSRQAVASIWDPVVDTAPGKDIPCNDWLNFSSRLGYLDLHVALRSNDIIWGWSGINQFEWSTLLEVMAGLLGLKMGSLHFSTTSFHIYDRHWKKSADIQEHAYRVTGLAASPRFEADLLPSRDIDGLDLALSHWLVLEKQIRHGDMSEEAVDCFPEPMLRSWLRVLQWWWSGEREYLSRLENTRLERASHYSVQPPVRQFKWSEPEAFEPKPVLTWDTRSDFLEYAIETHNEKHEAYGDSWKRRGEMLGIMTNIARKIDRLGGSETSDETSADTAMDLMIYLAKYKTWLGDYVLHEGTNTSDTPAAANDLLIDVERKIGPDLHLNLQATEDYLRDAFDLLEQKVDGKDPNRDRLVTDMLWEAYRLARHLYDEAQDEYRGADHD